MVDIANRLPRLRTLEDQCALRARKASRQRDEIVTQLETLTQYRNEYQATHSTVPALMVDAQCFIERLDNSISQLNIALQLQTQVFQAAESRWRQAQARTRAVEILVERRRLENARILFQRDRKMADTLLVLKQAKERQQGKKL